MTDVTDAELVAGALRGEAAPFAELILRHQDRMARYAARMLGDLRDAEEAVQDAFIRAHRALHQCEAPDRFGGWLFRILVNRCRTRGRRRRRYNETFVTGDVPVEPGVDHTAEQVAWREEIQRALARLGPEQREAFLLKHVEELSYEEMAQATGSSVPALKMRVKRACEHLREQLAEVVDG
ncbi:MAG TPA: RNA polymerase sigma factor [Gemmatimonadales bacterium]|nr:RNA polymerase sigma factor [Gemmatimonadales bacterium]